ncbi:MAG TPA: hypothetical protein VNQ73_13325 [Ilumatobacter sp.]|nr:hypothetical protein [Ilumatobacter sp.]
MTRRFTRRGMLAAGGAAMAAPLAAGSTGTATSRALPTGSLKTLVTPVRVFDTRAPDNFFGRKLGPGDAVAVAVSGAYAGDDAASAVFVNVTITGTEGAGYLAVTAEDLSGEQPLPTTSNINWSSNDLTLANLALTAVGDEHSITIWCRGSGRTHVVVDVQGYVPFAI